MSERNDMRPYTLFYYPSYRLPPHAMSQNDTCQLWCLVDGEKKPFQCPVSLNWKVDELLDAIQQRRSALRDVDIMDLVLYKVV